MAFDAVAASNASLKEAFVRMIAKINHRPRWQLPLVGWAVAAVASSQDQTQEVPVTETCLWNELIRQSHFEKGSEFTNTANGVLVLFLRSWTKIFHPTQM